MATRQMIDHATEKSALRAAMRAARTAFAVGRPPIAPPEAFLALLRPDIVVAAYLPLIGEADPGCLADAALACGARLALPHVVSADQPMRFLSWAPDEPLAAGPLSLRQPDAGARALSPDIVLTPLIAFDRNGGRLGQGGGYYDRAFAALPRALRIGIGWSIQQVDTVPRDRWDMPLNHIITENEWITRISTA